MVDISFAYKPVPPPLHHPRTMWPSTKITQRHLFINYLLWVAELKHLAMVCITTARAKESTRGIQIHTFAN